MPDAEGQRARVIEARKDPEHRTVDGEFAGAVDSRGKGRDQKARACQGEEAGAPFRRTEAPHPGADPEPSKTDGKLNPEGGGQVAERALLVKRHGGARLRSVVGQHPDLDLALPQDRFDLTLTRKESPHLRVGLEDVGLVDQIPWRPDRRARRSQPVKATSTPRRGMFRAGPSGSMSSIQIRSSSGCDESLSPNQGAFTAARNHHEAPATKPMIMAAEQDGDGRRPHAQGSFSPN